MYAGKIFLPKMPLKIVKWNKNLSGKTQFHNG